MAKVEGSNPFIRLRSVMGFADEGGLVGGDTWLCVRLARTIRE
jgi:hypothetical protein